jgi:hypothetical protein
MISLELHDLNTVLDEMHEYICLDIAAGFKKPDDIVEAVVELLGDEANRVVLGIAARRLVHEGIDVQMAEQATWPAITDCDRLDAAFAALDEAGIVCRQNFCCCGSCGAAEIWGEIEAECKRGRDVCGYVFYHAQDTDSAVEGDDLHLNYGALVDGEVAALAVANKIIAVLENHGLRTDWNGHSERRIGVRLDWKRRRAA